MHEQLTRMVMAGALALTSATALAEQAPAPGPKDERIRTVRYDAHDVTLIKGQFGYAQTVAFRKNETIQNIAIGDSLAWQVTPNDSGNRIFLKPVAREADTNLTIVTDKREYAFELRAAEGNAADMTYIVRFRYPEVRQRELREQARQSQARREHARAQEITPDRSVAPEAWNLNYSYKGPETLAPKHVFDDGRFTYFQFREGQEIPAIFLVRPDGSETLVNFHARGRYIVVERTGAQFTLRAGAGELCVFNDAAAAGANTSQPNTMDADGNVKDGDAKSNGDEA